MACRMGVRESKAKRQAGITNNNGVQISRCFLGRKEKATGSWMIADPLSRGMPAAPTGIRRFNTYVTSERRRIVAQVRREVPKHRDFFAVRDSVRCCGDLLATTVDNAYWAGL